MRHPLLAMFTAFLSASACAQVQFRTIALSGTPATGLPGLSFAAVSDPLLSDAGLVAFRARLAGPGVNSLNDSALYSDRAFPGLPALQFRESDPAPFANDTLNGLTSFAFTAAARLSFATALLPGADPPRTTVGLFAEGPDTPPALLVIDGTQQWLTPVLAAPNSAGRAAWARAGTIQRIDSNFGVAYSTLTPVPGLPGSFMFRRFAQPVIDRDGGLAFAAAAGEAGGPDVWGIWSDARGALDLIAVAGAPAPGAPDGAVFRELSHTPLPESGEVLFHARFAAGETAPGFDTGIWRGDGNQLNPIIIAEQPAPGTDARFKSVHRRIAAASGFVVFRAFTDSPDTSANSGIWLLRPSGELIPVALEGAPAPGMPDGVRFGELGDPHLSPSGRIAFLAQLRGGGVDQTSSWALFADLGPAGLRPTVRTGDLFQIPGADARPVHHIAFDSSSREQSRSQLGARGAIAFTLFFTDRQSNGVFLAFRCTADFNDDGQADFFDYLDFVQAFADDDPSADINGDGQVDFFDYLDFVAAFAAGC